MTQTHLTDTRFASFDLDPRILQGLQDAGFTHCTPIQAEILPLALPGRDVAGQAQTGTGKTAAFLVTALQRLVTYEPHPQRRVNQPRVVIVAPTRELAVQIHRDTVVLNRHTGFRLGLVYGGTGYQEQRDVLNTGVDILVGTPGRLIDYYKQGVFDLRAVEVAVIDEADRMFDLGFIRDIRYLLRRMPPPTKRQGMLFSATLSYRVTELAYEHMNHPHPVKIQPDQVTADRVSQHCFMIANDEKIPLLVGLLRGLEQARVIVFANTKRATEAIWGYLEGHSLHAAVLSGDVPQKKRLRLLKQFQEGGLPILVATDVAARGLHIPDVTHVINYDLPEDAEDYVHRIGRTARAGAAGDAVSFVCETYAFCLPDIEAFIGAKIAIRPVTPDLLAEIDPARFVRTPRRRHPQDKRRGHGHGHGGRHKSRPQAVEGEPHKAETKETEGAGVKQHRRRRRRKTGGAGDGDSTLAPPS
ncbi:DEAD/DEAH box helicase [Candidatus Thiosymbion oneisti]|uniref:DEAD/DEAH box helicase n=1 Tax=Candidatus Thiosymbion oneisti TaxID=589554 RepID=UPI000B00AFAF|nr:DEAD/DEAH box helicase [Candidatus Thiosymbion oneisti]